MREAGACTELFRNGQIRRAGDQIERNFKEDRAFAAGIW
jgi:hypothetical protein